MPKLDLTTTKMSPKNNAEPPTTRFTLLSLAICTVTTITVEGFAPGKIPTPLARNRIHSELHQPHVFRPTPTKYRRRHLLGTLPETSQQAKDTPQKLIEKETEIVSDDSAMSEAQLELLPEMELSFDEPSAYDTDILSNLESQQIDAISPYHVDEGKNKAKSITKDQSRENEMDELDQRSLNEIRLGYDAAARQIGGVLSADAEVSETDMTEENAMKNESFDDEVPHLVANVIEEQTINLDQDAESRQRALLEARLVMEARIRENAAVEAKRMASMAAELKQRSLLKTRLRLDSAARQAKADALPHIQIKDTAEIEVVVDSIDFINEEMSAHNKEKEQEAIKIAVTEPEPLYVLESSDNDKPNINEVLTEREQAAESNQRALLETRLMLEAKMRANAAAEAKTKASMATELKQRSLLEARLRFESTARQAKTDALADTEMKETDETKAENDVVPGSFDSEHAEMSVRNEERDQADIKIVATELEHLSVLESSDNDTPKIDDEIAELEQAAESRQRALLKTRLVWEAKARFKAAAKASTVGSETTGANLQIDKEEELVMDTVSSEPIGIPNIFAEGGIKEAKVALTEIGDRGDSVYTDLPLVSSQAKASVSSSQEENREVLGKKEARSDTSKNNITSMEGETTEMNTKPRTSQARNTWFKPKNSITNLMGKAEKDILSCGVGHFSNCILESGATAFLAANSVVEFTTNPEVVETAKKGIMSVSEEEDGFIKTKKAISFLGSTAESLLRHAGTSKTCRNTLSCAAGATSDFISGCVAMTAFGLKVGGNIRDNYIAAKKAEEEARIKAEIEAEKARKAEEERRRIEEERIEAERQALELIQKKAKKEKKRVKMQMMEAEAKALEKIRREAKEEENRIERKYEDAIKVLRENGPTVFLTDVETYNMHEDAQTKSETELFFAS